MSKKFKVVYIIIIMLMCALPMLILPFYKNDARIEKRELNKFPKYIESGRLNQDFSSGFEGWLNDRIPFRAYMLSASNYLRTEVLKASSSNVICGKDGWLYYESESKDYMNSNALDDNQIKAAAISLSLIEEHINANGGAFTFAIAPNKSSVYGEYMPDCYKGAKDNNLTRLNDALANEGVTHVDLKELLCDKKDEGLYHRRDSHWNYKGALIGYNAILDSLGREHETYQDMNFKKVKTWRGDLDKLLYPAGGILDYQYEYDMDYGNIMFTGPGQGGPKERLANYMSDREQGDDLISAKCKSVDDGSSLYMVRDSFSRALLPLMINAYQTSTFKRSKSPDITAVPDGADFCYEIVERNISQLVESPPFMYAPKRDEIDIDSHGKSEDIKAYSRAEGYGLKLYGVLSSANIKEGRVYVVLKSDEDSRTYEAFPIIDKELNQGDGPCGSANQGDGPSGQVNQGNQGDGPSGHGPSGQYGYSAVISPDEGLKGQYSVYIISEGKCYPAGEVSVK